MAAKNIDLMSPKEKRLLNELKKAENDYINENAMLIQQAGRTILKIKDETGVSLITQLIVRKVNFDLNNPKCINLKDYAAFVDDKKVDKVDAVVNASDIFKGITAIGEKK